MEIEYKWDLLPVEGSRLALDVAELISPHVRGAHDVFMHATYYDTADGLMEGMRAGLRLRRENDESVCCLKLEERVEGGLSERREYEAAADDVSQAVETLRQAGAPGDICDALAAAQLVVLCETEFQRRAFDLQVEGEGGFSAELAFDEGVLRHEGREQELHEMELELKDGSLEAFGAFAEAVEKRLGVRPQPLSKLARALQV